MILYGSSMSPYVRKVLAFAAEKEIELDLKPIGLGVQDPEFRETSPFGKIPGFRDGDFCISDSTAIVFYLEGVQPEPSLIPDAPQARARTIYWDEFADTMLAACGNKMFFNRIVAPRFLGRDGDEAAARLAQTEELPPLLDYLERSVPQEGYLVEDRITLADLAVASPFVNLLHLGVEIDAEAYPRLAGYLDRIHARPSLSRWIDKERSFFARAGAG